MPIFNPDTAKQQVACDNDYATGRHWRDEPRTSRPVVVDLNDGSTHQHEAVDWTFTSDAGGWVTLWDSKSRPVASYACDFVRLIYAAPAADQ